VAEARRVPYDLAQQLARFDPERRTGRPRRASVPSRHEMSGYTFAFHQIAEYGVVATGFR
jgi:hypothetical protein